MEGLERLNLLSENEAREALMRCCGSSHWTEKMLRQRPFSSEDKLFSAAQAAWGEVTPKDWLEAFTHHPRIGDVESLRKKFGSTAQWASQEQKGVQGASEAVLQALAAGNQEYEKKFGFIFLVCATGKTADEMLELLKKRMHNDTETELRVAAAEQDKITRIRLEKLIHP
jgi:2-oxo-4-hydroxy-4-carboxy-5-ureidoimidazoline decarboxylase